MELEDLKRGQLVCGVKDDATQEKNLYVLTNIIKFPRGHRIVYQSITTGCELDIPLVHFRKKFNIIANPTERKRLFKEPTECKHCNDTISGYRHCQACDTLLADTCMECHAEIAHGVYLVTRNVSKCGNGVPYTEEDAQYFPSIPNNRWYHNRLSER